MCVAIRLLCVCAAAVVAGGAVGCVEGRSESTPNAEGPQGVFKRASEHDVAANRYRIDPPDTIAIKSARVREWEGPAQPVRPDGRITLPLVGDVPVAGKTPEELAALLKRLASTFYENPDIVVEVTPASKFFTIFGFGVGQQRKVPWTGRDSVVSALAESGFSREGWPERVHLSRPGKNGRENATAVINFQKVFESGDLSQNYLLEEGDILWVPERPLAKFNRTATEALGPITGASVGVSAGRTITSGG